MNAITQITIEQVKELVEQEFEYSDQAVKDAAFLAGEIALNNMDIDWVVDVFQDSFLAAYSDAMQDSKPIALETIQNHSNDAQLAYIKQEMHKNYDEYLPHRLSA